MTARPYRFQALLSVSQPAGSPVAVVPPGQVRRMAIRGQRHNSGDPRLFCALVSNNGDDAGWLDAGHLVVTIALTGEDLREFFDVGDHFSLWLGEDVAHGTVTRRLFV